jgi:hypothetical protein
LQVIAAGPGYTNRDGKFIPVNVKALTVTATDDSTGLCAHFVRRLATAFCCPSTAAMSLRYVVVGYGTLMPLMFASVSRRCALMLLLQVGEEEYHMYRDEDILATMLK